MEATKTAPRRRRKRRTGRKGAVAAFAVAVLIAAVVIGYALTHPDYAPPVIEGVQAQLACEDDADIPALLRQGVEGRGGEDRPDITFPVGVTVLDAGGQEVTGPYLPGTYTVRYTCVDDQGKEAQAVECALSVSQSDHIPPVITGVQDQRVNQGGEVSYRTGVSVTDNLDERVELVIDSSQVDLDTPGEYEVIYSATDAHGNTARATARITVVETAVLSGAGGDTVIDRDEIDAMCDKILGEILEEGMTQREKARAIHTYVLRHIKFVGDSDKSSWLVGAYVGFTQKRGDCFNYFACSKALLTRAGISNVDIRRKGGNTDHYWQAVDVGEGYYHFDACPHSVKFPIDSFLLTDAQAEEYSARRGDDYYTYDKEACPVDII